MWFVGFTPELTTAVWIGQPDRGNFEMTDDNLPEFGRNVQGGRFAAPIWKVAMDAALATTPPSDWTAPPANPRPAARLYLPGTECIYQQVTRVIPGVPSAEPPPPEVTGPDGVVIPPEPTEPPQPVTVTENVPVADTGTTVPQFDSVNPTSPVPSIATGRYVAPCGRAGTVQTTTTTTGG